MFRTVVAALVLLCAPTLAGARGPSTPAERKRAIELTRKLEKQPLARSSNQDRAWLVEFIVEAPDFQVKSCSGPLDALAKDEENPYARALYVQSVFGMAAFIFENPKKADDWAAVQAAGIESTLRAYESLLKADPDSRWKELDRLLDARGKGRLRALVEKEMAKCPTSEDEGSAPSDAI